MLRSLKALHQTEIEATDGPVGHIARCLIDADRWVARYLVVDAGDWWEEHEVLISPLSLNPNVTNDRRIGVSLTRAEIRNSPEYDRTRPFTREHEATFFDYYGYPPYWTGPFLWGPLPSAVAPSGLAVPELDARRPAAGGTAVLESARGELGLADSQDVLGTHLHATDGDIGHVEDFLVEDETWSLRYLIVDTSNWWIGKQVLISPDWIDRFDWPAGKLHIGLDRASVKGAPEYDGTTPPNRDTEAALYRHHGRPPYWIE
jgi:hypothetical protein